MSMPDPTPNPAETGAPAMPAQSPPDQSGISSAEGPSVSPEAPPAPSYPGPPQPPAAEPAASAPEAAEAAPPADAGAEAPGDAGDASEAGGDADEPRPPDIPANVAPWLVDALSYLHNRVSALESRL